MKRISFLFFLILISVTCTYAQMTNDMYNFIKLAEFKKDQQRGTTKEQAEEFLGIVLDNRIARKSKVSYDSVETVVGYPQEIPRFSITFHNNVATILTFNFTEPLKEFRYYLSRLKGFGRLTLSRQQANGLSVYYLEGPDINSSRSKKYWVRLYECSDKPEYYCLRRAELVFADSGTIL